MAKRKIPDSAGYYSVVRESERQFVQADLVQCMYAAPLCVSSHEISQLL